MSWSLAWSQEIEKQNKKTDALRKHWLPRNISTDLISGMKLPHQSTSGSWYVLSWPTVMNDKSEHWGKFESDKEMLVSWTRPRSRREYLKMRTVMSRLPQLMMTALEDARFARLLIFRSDYFLFCKYCIHFESSTEETWHTWQEDVLVNTFNRRVLWWAVSLERSLSYTNHLSGNFYLCNRD